MLVVTQTLSYGVKVLDTEDGVSEYCTNTRLVDYIQRGVRVYGARVIADMLGNPNVFINLGESYDALQSIGYRTDVIRY